MYICDVTTFISHASLQNISCKTAATVDLIGQNFMSDKISVTHEKLNHFHPTKNFVRRKFCGKLKFMFFSFTFFTGEAKTKEKKADLHNFFKVNILTK